MEKIRMAYAEVDSILKLIDDELINKIPNNVRKFFECEKADDYIVHIDIEKSLNEQKIQRETVVILTMLNMQYWCKSENERKEILDLLIKNDKEEKRLSKEKCDFNELMKLNNYF